MSVDLDVDEWAEPPTVEERLAELEGIVLDLRAKLAAKQAEEEPPPLKYETLPDFVRWFAGWYRRDVFIGHELNWCRQWWKHDEAALRLDCLWRSFELLRHEAGTGLSSWLRDHVDVHMPRLMAEDGPLEGCTPEAHAERPLRELPVEDPPPDWWAPADSGPTATPKRPVTKVAA